MSTDRMVPVKYLYELRDFRCGSAIDRELLAVSIYRGVVPRSEITENEPRADDLANYKRVEPGEIVINRMSAYQGALGIAKQKGIVSPEYLVLRILNGVEPRFLAHLFKSSWFVGEMASRVRGIGSLEQGNVRTPRINPENLGEILVPVPALAQQRAIADFLNAETARIDALIGKKRRMRQLLGERIAAHVEQKTHASSISMVEDDPLPEKWRSVVLRRCFKLIQYGIGEASREVGTIAVLGMGNVDHGEIVGHPGGFVDQIDPSLLLEPGDLLFNRTNSLALVGKVALVRDSTATTFASYLVRLRTNHLADSAYLNYLLNTRPVLEQARSMALPSIGQANLNPSRYTSIRVPLPPVQIQRSIVSELDLEATTHARLSAALVRQIELLAEHRQALITAAVTGQIEVPRVAAS